MKLKRLGFTLALVSTLFGLASCGPKGTTRLNAPDENGKSDSGEGDNKTGEGTGGNTTSPVADTPVVFENSTSKLSFISVAGDQESLYATFKPVENAKKYNAYVSNDGINWIKLDDELIRLYKNDEYYYRVDAVGLAAGKYQLKINPVIDNQESDDKGNLAKDIMCIAYDRTGFAFSKSSDLKGDAPGAYKMDGTLKDGAKVIYLTEDNKDKVTMDIKGTTYTGIANITGAFKTKNNTPALDIRVIGKVNIKGLICEDMAKWHCLGIKAGSNLTIEGIGDDATMYGGGVGCNDSTGVEFRNLGFMEWGSLNADSDAIAMQGSKNVWVHDNDIFYGHKQSGDQAKGDGSCDLKDDSQFVTISYNHFWDSGKMSLCGMKSETGENYISYHHNWFDHSDSRHPRIRTMTVHVYNNYYDGNSKYGIGAVKGAQCLAEGNYFRNCKYPFLVGGYGNDALFSKTIFSGEKQGFIKAYNNTIEGATALMYANAEKGVAGSTAAGSLENSDAYLASSRDEVISASYKNGVSYSNFDTNGSVDLGVTASQIQSPEASVEIVKQYSGRVAGGDFTYEFDNPTADKDDAIDTILASKILSYKTNMVSIQGLDITNTENNTQEDTSLKSTDVIALIDALPDSSNVVASNRGAILEARSKYNALSEEEKQKVNNIDKLVACEEALAALPQEANVCTFPYTGDYFDISGNTATNKGSVTYNGNTYSTCLKIESATSITFVAATDVTLTIVLGTSGANNIKVDGTKYTGNSDYIITLSLKAGSHTITKGDTANLFYLLVE